MKDIKETILSKLNKRQEGYVCVIGGANMDIFGRPVVKLICGDSNPGKINATLGGVGRNIAENLGKLGLSSEFITVIGGDEAAREIISNCKDNNVSLANSIIMPDKASSTYLYIMDENSDMKFAISDMDLYSYITPSFLESKLGVINASYACVVDTNIPKDSIEFIFKNCTAPIFVDAVSIKKSGKIKGGMNGVYAVKANMMEAGFLTSMEIKTDEDIRKAASILIDKGVKEVFISMGKNGIYYCDRNKGDFLKPIKVAPKNTTGAGDSLMAGIVAGFSKGMSLEETANFAVIVSGITVESLNTVSENMSCKEVRRRINNYTYRED